MAKGREQWRHGQWDQPPKHVAAVFWLDFLIRTKVKDERERHGRGFDERERVICYRVLERDH